jgi:uncharacterized membrane protein
LFWYANLANLFDVCSTVIGVKIMWNIEVNFLFKYFTLFSSKDWNLYTFLAFKILFVLSWLNYVRRRDNQETQMIYFLWSFILFEILTFSNLFVVIF